MKKLVLLAVTAIVIAAVLFFGVKAIKATPKAEADAGQTVATATSVPVQATPTPAPTATPKPTPATPASTATPAPATSEEATPSDATASEAKPADPAEAYIESLREAGIHAEEIPAMARDEEKGYLKIVKVDDPALTDYSAMDLTLGDDPEWCFPTCSGKPIVGGRAYMTRCVATVVGVVPDWYCTKHRAVKSSCDTTSEDYTLYKGVIPAEALKATRLVSGEDGGFEWCEAHCECGTTEKVTGGGPGGSSPTKKPTTTTKPTQKPQAPAHEPEPTLPPKTEAEHEVAPTLPPKKNDSKPNHSSPNNNEAPPSMGGDTW